jgi:hypothetical protein
MRTEDVDYLIDHSDCLLTTHCGNFAFKIDRPGCTFLVVKTYFKDGLFWKENRHRQINIVNIKGKKEIRTLLRDYIQKEYQRIKGHAI